MSNEEDPEGEPMYPSEAEVNAGRKLTMGERVVGRIMGSRPRCPGCRK